MRRRLDQRGRWSSFGQYGRRYFAQNMLSLWTADKYDAKIRILGAIRLAWNCGAQECDAHFHRTNHINHQRRTAQLRGRICFAKISKKVQRDRPLDHCTCVHFIPISNESIPILQWSPTQTEENEFIFNFSRIIEQRSFSCQLAHHWCHPLVSLIYHTGVDITLHRPTNI